MSDLEIDFEEALELAIKYQGYGLYWAEKIAEITKHWGFDNVIQTVVMFNDWVDDRYAGLHA